MAYCESENPRGCSIWFLFANFRANTRNVSYTNTLPVMQEKFASFHIIQLFDLYLSFKTDK